MNKLSAVFTAIVVAVFGLGNVADAANAYPPNGISVVATPASGGPGYQVTVTVNCTVGERVTVTLVDSTDRVSCTADPDGSTRTASATGVVVAPSSLGDFTGSVEGSRSGSLGQFTITVRAAAGSGADVDVTQARGVAAGETVSSDYIRTVVRSLFIVAICVMAVAVFRRREMLLGA